MVVQQYKKKSNLVDSSSVNFDKVVSIEGDFEYRCAKTKPSNKPNFLEVCRYRAPSGDLFELLQYVFSFSSKRLIVCGDFNVDSLESRNNDEAQEVVQLFQSFGLTPHVQEATRIRRTSECS
mgnify:CR=1 FL=1